jgi:hypothetical protein
MEYRLVQVSETVSIRIPEELTAAQESEVIAHFRWLLENRDQVEAEFREMLEHPENLVPVQDLLQDLENT